MSSHLFSLISSDVKYLPLYSISGFACWGPELSEKLFVKHFVLWNKVSLWKVWVIPSNCSRVKNCHSPVFFSLHMPCTQSIWNKEEFTFQARVQKNKAAIVPEGVWKSCQVKQREVWLVLQIVWKIIRPQYSWQSP